MQHVTHATDGYKWQRYTHTVRERQTGTWMTQVKTKRQGKERQIMRWHPCTQPYCQLEWGVVTSTSTQKAGDDDLFVWWLVWWSHRWANMVAEWMRRFLSTRNSLPLLLRSSSSFFSLSFSCLLQDCAGRIHVRHETGDKGTEADMGVESVTRIASEEWHKQQVSTETWGCCVQVYRACIKGAGIRIHFFPRNRHAAMHVFDFGCWLSSPPPLQWVTWQSLSCDTILCMYVCGVCVSICFYR